MSNISPEIWGSHGWKFMHYISFTYPINPTQEDKINYKKYFTSVGDVLPCQKCRTNFKNHLSKFPLNDNVLSTNSTLVAWLINIHNEVNKINGKKEYTLDEILKIYFPNEKTFNTNKIIISIVLILLIIVIIYTIKN